VVATPVTFAERAELALALPVILTDLSAFEVNLPLIFADRSDDVEALPVIFADRSELAAVPDVTVKLRIVDQAPQALVPDGSLARTLQ
jgi:hypothetical protein